MANEYEAVDPFPIISPDFNDGQLFQALVDACSLDDFPAIRDSIFLLSFIVTTGQSL